jgi:hypothetical protein
MQTKAHKLGITEFPYYEYNEKGKKKKALNRYSIKILEMITQ